MVIFLSFILALVRLTTLHPFHASVCEIEYNPRNNALEISYRMFLDDLENALNKRYEESINIMDPGQKEKVDQRVENYLDEKFKFRVNGKPVELQYLGSEIEGYALWCFIEIPNIISLEAIEVDNKVMLELFDDQINLVHFNKEDKVISLKLISDRSYGILRLADLYGN